MKQHGNNQYQKVTTSSFIESMSILHNNKYDYSKVIYLNNKKKVEIICPEHGSFWQTPNKHQQGRICPKCANKTRGRFPKQTTEDFIIKANKVHAFKYIYDKTIYVKNHEQVIITCPVHGDFLQSPANHKAGQGCPSCKIPGYKPYLPGLLYYICIDGKYYKIGITNRSIQERFSNADLKRIRVVQTWKYADGKECYIQEQQYIKQFKKYIFSGPDLLDSVKTTEIFTQDILQLDNTKSGSGTL